MAYARPNPSYVLVPLPSSSMMSRELGDADWVEERERRQEDQDVRHTRTGTHRRHTEQCSGWRKEVSV